MNDGQILKKLHENTFLISKEEKPIETIIKASDSTELNINPTKIKEWDFIIHEHNMTRIHPDNHIGNLTDLNKYKQNIKVKEFDIDIKPYHMFKESNNINNKIQFGNTNLKNFHPKGHSEEYAETENNIAGNSSIYNIDDLNKISEHDKHYQEFEKQRLELEQEKERQLTKVSNDKDKANIEEMFEKKSSRLERRLKANKPIQVRSVKPIAPPTTPIKSKSSSPITTPLTPTKKKSNSKQQGDQGFVREEAKLIEEIASNKPIEEEEKKKDKASKLISKAYKKHKEKQLEFDVAEDEAQQKTGFKKTRIDLLPEEKSKYYEYMTLGKGGKFTDEAIRGLQSLFGDDIIINKQMKKLELENYLTRTYTTNFAITKKPKAQNL